MTLDPSTEAELARIKRKHIEHEAGRGVDGPRSRKGRRSPVQPDWLKQCAVDSKGRPLPTLENAMVALRNDPAINQAFGFDEMLRSVVIMGAMGAKPRRATDVDISALQEQLQIAGLKNLG